MWQFSGLEVGVWAEDPDTEMPISLLDAAAEQLCLYVHDSLGNNGLETFIQRTDAGVACLSGIAEKLCLPRDSLLAPRPLRWRHRGVSWATLDAIRAQALFPWGSPTYQGLQYCDRAGSPYESKNRHELFRTLIPEPV